MSKRAKVSSRATTDHVNVETSAADSNEAIAQSAMRGLPPADAPRLGLGVANAERDESWRLIEVDIPALARERDYLRSRVFIEERRRICAEERAHALEVSLSWRLTAPIRFISRRVPRMARAFRLVGRRIRGALRKLSGRDPHEGETERDPDADLLLASPLFDEEWYRAQAPNAGPTRSSAVAHFLAFGARMGIDPHPLFRCDWYLTENSDVMMSGQNPLVHYLKEGDKEGRNPHPLFDSTWYAAACKEALLSFCGTRLEHFLDTARSLRCDPHPLFSCDWYIREYEDVLGRAANPLIDYILDGHRVGRDPSPFFNGDWYRRQAGAALRPDEPPLLHYVRAGARAGLSPREGFNAEFVKRSTFGLDEVAETPLATYVRMRSRFLACQAVDSEDLPSAVLWSHPRKRQLFVGVVAYQASREDLERFVRSVRTSAHVGDQFGVELGLVSNGPTNIVADALAVGFSYAEHADNHGFGHAQNLLMRRGFASGANLYVAANPDGFFHRQCLWHLASASGFFGDACLVEAREFPEEHPKIFDPLSLDTPWACGACLGIPRRVWEDIGGFDENIFMYCEDVDLSWRARRAGWGVKHVPYALYYHDTRDRSTQSWRQRKSLESALYLSRKWSASYLERAILTEMRRQEMHDGDLMPVLGDCGNTPEFVDEDHALSFAPVRWI